MLGAVSELTYLVEGRVHGQLCMDNLQGGRLDANIGRALTERGRSGEEEKGSKINRQADRQPMRG